MGPYRRLIDLDARFEDNILVFNCPCNRCKDIRENPNEERNKFWCDARIRIPILPQVNGWELTAGEFPNITLQPSILIGTPSKNNLGGCEGWHGYLINGILTPCE